MKLPRLVVLSLAIAFALGLALNSEEHNSRYG